MQRRPRSNRNPSFPKTRRAPIRQLAAPKHVTRPPVRKLPPNQRGR
jgi:hypothetical protein